MISKTTHFCTAFCLGSSLPLAVHAGKEPGFISLLKTCFSVVETITRETGSNPLQ